MGTLETHRLLKEKFENIQYSMRKERIFFIRKRSKCESVLNFDRRAIICCFFIKGKKVQDIQHEFLSTFELSHIFAIMISQLKIKFYEAQKSVEQSIREARPRIDCYGFTGKEISSKCRNHIS